MKNKTITKELITMISISFFITLLGVISIHFLSTYKDDLHREIVDRNEMTSCMHIVLTRMSSALENSDMDEYNYNSDKFINYVETISDLSKGRDETSNQLIRIEEKFNTLSNLDTNDTESVNTTIDELKYLVQILVIDDLQITKDLYVIEVEEVNTIYTSIVLLLLFIIAAVYIGMYRKIVFIKNRLSSVVEGTMNIVNNDFLGDDLKDESYTEINELSHSINQMKNQIHLHLDEINKNHSIKLEKERSEKLLSESRFELLKNQINPHFLFNALNLISSKLDSSQEDIKYNIESLCDIMRYSIENKDELVKLEKDIDVVELYLSIQKERFAPNLSYEIDVDEHAYHYTILPMLLQPFIENSIKHGFYENNHLHILCSIKDNHDSLDILIQDNGKGFDVKGVTYGIGINNVIERIHIYYKGKGNVEIFSMKEFGSKVMITLPKEF